MKHFTALLLSLCVTASLKAQETPHLVKNPPINVESFFSDRGVGYQMIVNKKLQGIPLLGFFGVTNLVGEWNQQAVRDYMTQGNLTYEIVKGLNLLGGFHVTNVSGFRPTVGLMYTFKSPELLVVVNPRIDVSSDAVVEGFSLIEYRPRMNDHWHFYTRLQGLYGHTTSLDFHARSYIVARLGVSYKTITFGVGTNLDRYGPMKQAINSYGVFCSAALF